jgi:signal transduction histidine kinase/CheY-like chemotaxis protein
MGEAHQGELRFRRHDGEYRLHAYRAEPIRDEHGTLQWFGACVDVEERKRAEVAMREQTEDFRTLLDMLPVGVWIAHDPECRRITGNRAGRELLRMAPDANLSKSASAEEQPKHFRILKGGREVPAADLPMQRAAHGEIVRAEEAVHEFDDGSRVHAIVSARPLFDPSGRPRGAIATVVDVTELKRAESAERRKTEFLAELGHELRNPLAPLMSALELLQRADCDPEHAGALLETMHRQLGYLASLVDDLLDLARVDRGEIHLDRVRLDLREAVDAAVELARPLIDERRHELMVEHAAVPLPVDGDRRRLTQLIANLLNNAAKYTDRGGTLRVSTELGAGQIVLRVRDTGFGIPSGQLETIFEMFSRVPEHRERIGGSGLGIGLALARRILDLHDGSIEARSEGLECGSEFVARLPLAEPAAESETAAAPAEPSEPSPRRVLVVDDNVDAAETLRMWLELEGHKALVVHDGPTALEAVPHFSPEVVLLDIGLPLMDGYDVARRIRALPGQHMLLVALTGWGQAEDRRRSSEAGFDLHLTKPVKGPKLQALLGR